MNFLARLVLSRLLRRIDKMTDAEIENAARRIDERIDLPWIGDAQEAKIIRGGVRAAVALVRELAAHIEGYRE